MFLVSTVAFALFIGLLSIFNLYKEPNSKNHRQEQRFSSAANLILLPNQISELFYQEVEYVLTIILAQGLL